MSDTSTVFAGLTGRIVRPGDPDYQAASTAWNHLFTHRPAVVVFAQHTQDVINALTWARHNSVPLRVRSGGHCLEGWSGVDDGMVIDVSDMKSATIDPVQNTATVGAGLNQMEAVTLLGEQGFITPTGTEGTVGLTGATLGGGFGLLTRALGMASDNLLAAEIVVASNSHGAEALTVDAENHPDLLWALRGAGNGNFGIVTSLTYRIYPQASTICLKAEWPLADLADVLDTWQRTAPHADDRLTSQLEIEGDTARLIAVLLGGTQSEAAEMLSPLLTLGPPAVSVTDTNWIDTYQGFQVPIADEPANWKFHSQFISEPFPKEAIDVICAFMAKAPEGCNYFTNAFGGAVANSEPVGGSVFAHRGTLFYAEPGAGWGIRGAAPSDDTSVAAEKLSWVAGFADALRPFVNGAYVNVPNPAMADWERAYWGVGVERLHRVKASYDPHNVFTYEQSVGRSDSPSTTRTGR